MVAASWCLLYFVPLEDPMTDDANRGGDDSGPNSGPPSVDLGLDDGPTRPVEGERGLPKTRGILVQMGGLEAGRLYRLSIEGTSLGRSKSCTMQFDDTSLSRVHARISQMAGHFVFEDVDSLNGSYVNGLRVKRAELSDGDRVRLGTGVSLRFQIMDEEEENALVSTYESSIRDGLTGIFNRRQLEERLSAEVSFALRHRTTVSAILLDIDHFKLINDTNGHLGGDAVLRAAAKTLTAAIRQEDILGRYGGEELLVVARGTALPGAVQVAERLRRAVDAMQVPFANTSLHVTVSVGVASLECCGEARSVMGLLRCADERLYRAKDLGRNRVVSV